MKAEGSKLTRLTIDKVLGNLDLRRDHIAHISRYLMFCEHIITKSKELRRPIKVLDLGCGEAHVLRTLFHTFPVKKTNILEKYVGVDAHDHSLKKWRGKAWGGVNVVLKTHDITKPIKSFAHNKEFDVVICSEVLEHIPKGTVPKLLKEINRTLRDDGTFLLSTPNHEGSNDKLPEDHVYEYGYSELYRLIKNVPFDVVGRYGIFMQSHNNNPEELRRYITREGQKLLKERFDKHFQSLIFATFQPAKANNVLWILQKGTTKNQRKVFQW